MMDPFRREDANPALGKFGWMFEELPSLQKDLGCPGDDPELKAGLAALARAMDPDPWMYRKDNAEALLPAGYPFLGQFITHDISFDHAPLGKRAARRQGVPSFRTPALDLDAIYGGGPSFDCFFFAPLDNPADLTRTCFLIDEDAPHDIPRTSTKRTPIIADTRNDETFVLSQLHLALIKLHNRLVSEFGYPYEDARRLAQWHYQYVVVNDYLERQLPPGMVDDVLRERRVFDPYARGAYIPFEFSVGAFRFGHAQIGRTYWVTRKRRGEVIELRGGRRPDEQIEWWRFFDFGEPGRQPQRSRLIDELVVTPVLNGAAAGPDGEGARAMPSLPLIDLERHIENSVPSGQRVAESLIKRGIAVEPLKPEEIIPAETRGEVPAWIGEHTPLLFYVLREAKCRQKGQRLGTVGGRIVAEVIIGLLESDPTSYLNARGGWVPEAEHRGADGEFRMDDLLRLAGVA